MGETAMSVRPLRWLALPVFGLALGAAPMPADWLRRGDEAFAAGQFEAALSCYGQAAERSTDPGRVAFNEGVSLYQLGRYREAELRFRCALDDAALPAARRGPALYDLGNCLLQESAGRSVGLLRDAIACYELCLADGRLEPELVIDTRHNLELAKVLWLEARRSAANGDREADEPPHSDRPPPRRDEPPPGANGPGDLGNQAQSAGPGQQADGTATGRQPGQQAPLPGEGNLPPVHDADELQQMTPEDLQAHLRSATERIRQERQVRVRRPVPAPESVRDW
jgi:tetratricopeptide (TPR) repeat protein